METIQTTIKSLVSTLFGVDEAVELTRTDPAFGDFATNIAMKLSKQLGENPRSIAEKLLPEIQKIDVVLEASIAGPGFINIRVTDEVITRALAYATQTPQTLAGKVIVAEYSDPNPFKVLHAGHLYTTLVGDAVSRLLEDAGATVHRLNFGGDVGLHVGKTMWAIIKHFGGEYPDKMAEVEADKRLEWVSERYVEGNEAYETDESAKAEIVAANKRVYELHAANDHESEFAKIYWLGREWSYTGFDALYEQLQASPFERYIPESEVTPLGLEIVQKGLKQNVFVESEGAIVFPGEDHGLHTRVFINSGGLPTYEAKDLGLAAQKWQDYHFDQNVIITANDIVEYMKVVVKALSNFYPEVAERTHHLTHGVIKLPGGVKMSSRKGNILRAVDIIEAAENAAQDLDNSSSNETILAAIKYAFLKTRIGGDVIYDPAEAVALEGNSGPYLQYAHARARSIASKSKVSIKNKLSDLDQGERTLAVKITEFTEVVGRAAESLNPHLICTYLYELSQEFNRFYEHNRVIDDPREAERLYLVNVYASVLKKGLELLGIHAPESM
jgi:arginyl-tRNA synthetase